MDSFARALLCADAILQQSEYRSLRAQRYASFDTGEGQQFEQGKLSLTDLRRLAETYGEPPVTSGRQEYFENIINRFI